MKFKEYHFQLIKDLLDVIKSIVPGVMVEYETGEYVYKIKLDLSYIGEPNTSVKIQIHPISQGLDCYIQTGKKVNDFTDSYKIYKQHMINLDVGKFLERIESIFKVKKDTRVKFTNSQSILRFNLMEYIANIYSGESVVDTFFSDYEVRYDFSKEGVNVEISITPDRHGIKVELTTSRNNKDEQKIVTVTGYTSFVFVIDAIRDIIDNSRTSDPKFTGFQKKLYSELCGFINDYYSTNVQEEEYSADCVEYGLHKYNFYVRIIIVPSDYGIVVYLNGYSTLNRIVVNHVADFKLVAYKIDNLIHFTGGRQQPAQHKYNRNKICPSITEIPRINDYRLEEKILNRINSLIILANDNAAKATHESQTAANIAEKLMDKHGISHRKPLLQSGSLVFDFLNACTTESVKS